MEITGTHEIVKGYKVFNPDWTCRGFQYEVGKVYEEDVEPSGCDRGFHFCLKASDCFNYYKFDSNNKVAEVVALGAVEYSVYDSKACTNKIQIVREIPWQELLTIVNIGKDCTGNRNTGDENTGNRNTGNCNTGNWNTGCMNTGNWNTGNCNIGDRNTGGMNIGDWNTGDENTGNDNTGSWNTGNRNTGNWNTGNWNTGDWNSCNHSTGCFCTEEKPIMLFNKPSPWSYSDWLNSDAHHLLNQMPKNVVKWIYSNDMADEEKTAHPFHETTDGYLKVLNESKCGQIWWDGLSEHNRNIIRALPNFDPVIFEQCTGIKMKG